MSQEQQKEYNDTLKTLLSIAKDDYKFLALDWRNRQTGLIKTYLWIAVTLIASELHIFSSVWNNKPSSFLLWHIEPFFLFYLFAVLALAVSFAVFILGIDTLRGRGGIFPIFTKNYSDFSVQRYEELYEDRQNTLYHDMLVMIDIANHNQRLQLKRTAYMLRTMSCLLLASVILSVLAVIPYAKILQ